MEWGGGWNDWDWLNLSCIVLGCSICWAPWSREYQNHTADGLLIRLPCNCDGMPGMPTMVPHHYRLMQVVALPPYNLAHMGRNLSCITIIQRVPGSWHFKKLFIGPGSNRSLPLSQAVSWNNVVQNWLLEILADVDIGAEESLSDPYDTTVSMTTAGQQLIYCNSSKLRVS